MLYDDVERKVKDASGTLVLDDYKGAVSEALKRYAKHRPRVLVADLPGTGAADLALPTGWSDGFSALHSLEYPVGKIPETFLDPRDFKLYRSPAGLKIRLLTVIPTVAQTVRATYTALHADETTVSAVDMDAVANLAAAVCLRLLAAKFGQTSDPTLQADVVNYRSKADEFRRLADAFEALYNEQLGIGKESHAPAASAIASAPDPSSKENLPFRLTHGRRG